MRYVIGCLVFVVVLSWSLAGCQKSSPQEAVVRSSGLSKVTARARPVVRTVRQNRQRPVVRKRRAPVPAHWFFRDAGQAMKQILALKPQIIGVGEYHQSHSFRHIPSAISRFTKSVLPVLKGGTDLLVETWVTTGQCGKREKVVVKEVRKVIKRPKKTTNHILDLLLAGKKLGMFPHILKAHCKDYEALQNKKKTGFDPLRMLRFVTQKLHSKTTWILRERAKRRQHAAIIVYGGAIHNDLHPSKDLLPFSYVPTLPKASRKKFVEVDLYVPEYIAGEASYQSEPWFPLMREGKKQHKVVLIQRAKRSFAILLLWQKNKPSKDLRPVHPVLERR